MTDSTKRDSIRQSIYEEIDAYDDWSRHTQITHKFTVKKMFEDKNFPKKLRPYLDGYSAASKRDPLECDYNNYAKILAICKSSSIFRALPCIASNFHQIEINYDEIQNSPEWAAIGNKKKEPRDADVKWTDLQLTLEQLNDPRITIHERLIYALYISPGIGATRRNDFTPVKIVDVFPEDNDKKINYYSKGFQKFKFNCYKTSKKYGTQIVDVCDEINKLIEDSIGDDDVWLWGGDTPIIENSLQKKIMRALTKLCGRHITINTVRRSFAEHMKENMNDGEKVVTAHQMGHSTTTNKIYAH